MNYENMCLAFFNLYPFLEPKTTNSHVRCMGAPLNIFILF